MKALTYNGQEITTKDSEMLCLTDMWRAADCPPNKRPAEWARYDGRQFIEFIAKNLNVGTAHIYKAGRGKSGKTYAHWQIGLAYAQYLSNEFHAWCNDVVKGHMEALAKKGLVREQGKVARKEWASACIQKGADQRGLAQGTNAIYTTFFKQTAKQLREREGLGKGDNIRDHMRTSTLMAVNLAEALAAERIQDMNKYGNEPCVLATKHCAEAIHKAVKDERNSRKSIEMAR